MPSTIDLLVTRPAPLILPELHAHPAIDGRATVGERLYKRVILKPGPNKGIDAKYWSLVREKAKKYLDAGYLIEIDETSVIPDELNPGVLIKMQTVDNALTAIKECSDTALLHEWARNDKRKTVRDAIMKRAEELQKAE